MAEIDNRSCDGRVERQKSFRANVKESYVGGGSVGSARALICVHHSSKGCISINVDQGLQI
jgi:hypothetical protein